MVFASGDLPRAVARTIRGVPAVLFSVPLLIHLGGPPSDFVHTGDLAVAIALSVFALYSVARLPVDARPAHWLLVCGPVAAVFAMDGAGRVDRSFGTGWPYGLLLGLVASLFVVHGLASARSSKRSEGIWQAISLPAKITAGLLAFTLVYAPWYGSVGLSDLSSVDGFLGYAAWTGPGNPGGFPAYWAADRIAFEWLGILTIIGLLSVVRNFRERPVPGGSA